MKKFKFKDGSIITASTAEEAKAKHKVMAARDSFPCQLEITEKLSGATTRKASRELAKLIKNEYELGGNGEEYFFRNTKDLDKAKKFFDAKKWKYKVSDYSTEVFSDAERKELANRGFKKVSSNYGEKWLNKKFRNIKGLWAFVEKVGNGFTAYIEWDNDYDDYVPRALRYFDFNWNMDYEENSGKKKYSSCKECLSALARYTAIVDRAMTEAKESEKRIKDIEKEIKALK